MRKKIPYMKWTLNEIAINGPIKSITIIENLKKSVTHKIHPTTIRKCIGTTKKPFNNNLLKKGWIKEYSIEKLKKKGRPSALYVLTFYGFLNFLINNELNDIDKCISNYSKIYPHDFFKLWNYIINDKHKDWAYKSLRMSAIKIKVDLDNQYNANGLFEPRLDWIEPDEIVYNKFNEIAYYLITEYRVMVGDYEVIKGNKEISLIRGDKSYPVIPDKNIKASNLKEILNEDSDIKDMFIDIYDNIKEKLEREKKDLDRFAREFKLSS